MGRIWQLIGLPEPDPSAPPNAPIESAAPDDEREANDIQDFLPIEYIDRSIPPPILSEGEFPHTAISAGFKDLGAIRWNEGKEEVPGKRLIRHVLPDEKRHRLDTNGITRALESGSILFVDLSDLVHLDAHREACKRELVALSERIETPVFVLDEGETIFLVPGAGIAIDPEDHHLGVKMEQMPIEHEFDMEL